MRVRAQVNTNGNFYGTTETGGGGCSCGTVFKLAPNGTETVLHAFQGGNDGRNPEDALIMDKTGNLYGTTYSGGSTRCHGGGCGIVFKIGPSKRETVLFAFGGGRFPAAGLLARPHGRFYGTTTAGGADKHGVVIRGIMAQTPQDFRRLWRPRSEAARLPLRLGRS